MRARAGGAAGSGDLCADPLSALAATVCRAPCRSCLPLSAIPYRTDWRRAPRRVGTHGTRLGSTWRQETRTPARDSSCTTRVGVSKLTSQRDEWRTKRRQDLKSLVAKRTAKLVRFRGRAAVDDACWGALCSELAACLGTRGSSSLAGRLAARCATAEYCRHYAAPQNTSTASCAAPSPPTCRSSSRRASN